MEFGERARPLYREKRRLFDENALEFTSSHFVSEDVLGRKHY